MSKITLISLVLLISVLIVFWIKIEILNSKFHTLENQSRPELASYMGELQRLSQKLNLSIKEKNNNLAAFYATEINETFIGLQNNIDKHDGYPIATWVVTMMEPKLRNLDQSLKSKNWEKIGENYKAMISACNQCHDATMQGYIKITPGIDGSGFNQDFSP